MRTTRMVLTNAVHFKGEWEKTFGKHLTRTEAFLLLGGNAQKPVEMMHHPSLKMRHRSFEHHAVIELPYKGNDVTMLILLPHANTADSLNNVRVASVVSCVVCVEHELRWCVSC